MKHGGTSKRRSRNDHPIAPYLRMDRMPHIWCPTCGIGTVVKCYATALEGSGLDLDKVAIVSGIGCTGRVAGYMNLDAFHTTHGRAIPFATGLKLGRPELKVTVFSGDGDLSGSAATTSSTPPAATSTCWWCSSTTSSTR